MATNRKLYLWSYRFTVARGWQWKREREVTLNDSLQWKDVYEKDEPSILFIIRANKPAN